MGAFEIGSSEGLLGQRSHRTSNGDPMCIVAMQEPRPTHITHEIKPLQIAAITGNEDVASLFGGSHELDSAIS